jgi:hypothetical protein
MAVPPLEVSAAAAEDVICVRAISRGAPAVLAGGNSSRHKLDRENAYTVGVEPLDAGGALARPTAGLLPILTRFLSCWGCSPRLRASGRSAATQAGLWTRVRATQTRLESRTSEF